MIDTISDSFLKQTALDYQISEDIITTAYNNSHNILEFYVALENYLMKRKEK